MLYFSVRKYLKIAGKTYVPCVCYELPTDLVPTVEKLVSEEKAYIYAEPVGFMNGKQLIKSKKTRKTNKKEAVKEEPKVKEEVPAEDETASF